MPVTPLVSLFTPPDWSLIIRLPAGGWFGLRLGLRIWPSFCDNSAKKSRVRSKWFAQPLTTCAALSGDACKILANIIAQERITYGGNAMTDLIDSRLQDVMQVCRNSHVITDLLHTYPDRGLSHCDRCGAATLDRCATCGLEIPGAVHVPGLVPVGRSQPPQFCSACGAPFPWSHKAEPETASDLLANLERLLRRLP